MSDPVVLLGDGMTYERNAIQSWLMQSKTSPLTAEELSCTVLVPNHSLKSVIAQYTEQQQRKHSVGAKQSTRKLHEKYEDVL